MNFSREFWIDNKFWACIIFLQSSTVISVIHYVVSTCFALNFKFWSIQSFFIINFIWIYSCRDKAGYRWNIEGIIFDILYSAELNEEQYWLCKTKKCVYLFCCVEETWKVILTLWKLENTTLYFSLTVCFISFKFISKQRFALIHILQHTGKCDHTWCCTSDAKCTGVVCSSKI